MKFTKCFNGFVNSKKNCIYWENLFVAVPSSEQRLIFLGKFQTLDLLVQALDDEDKTM